MSLFWSKMNCFFLLLMLWDNVNCIFNKFNFLKASCDTHNNFQISPLLIDFGKNKGERFLENFQKTFFFRIFPLKISQRFAPEKFSKKTKGISGVLCGDHEIIKKKEIKIIIKHIGIGILISFSYSLLVRKVKTNMLL